MVIKNANLLTSLKDKTLGLIFRSDQQVVCFKTRFGIHTFGMNSAITVLVLDNSNKVIKVKANLAPNRLFFWNPIFDRVVELPARRVQNIRLGEKLIFVPKLKNW